MSDTGKPDTITNAEVERLADERAQRLKTHYLLTLFGLFVVAMGSVTAIEVFRPNRDNSVIITMIIASMGPTALGLMSLLQGTQNAVGQKVIHKLVNSQATIQNEKIDRQAELLEEQRQENRKQAQLLAEIYQKFLEKSEQYERQLGKAEGPDVPATLPAVTVPVKIVSSTDVTAVHPPPPEESKEAK